MLDRLPETGARRRKPGWGGTASVIVHGAIIGLVIAKTGSAKPPGRITEEGILVPISAPIPDTPPGGNTGAGPGRHAVDTSLPVPQVPVFGPIDVRSPMPPSDGIAGADTAVISEIVGSGGGGTNGIGGTGTGIASDNVVDTPVRVLAERVPTYPEMLRSAGISGSVTMQFVIDTLGRVEPASLRVLASNHELFTRSVVASLRQARFTPGEVSGHRVRTLVERSFRFDIAGAR